MTILDVVFVYQMKDEVDLAWHCRRHSHNEAEYEAHYFLQGEGHFRDGERLYIARPGACFLTRPGSPHAIVAQGAGDPVTYYAVLFRVGPDDGELPTLLEDLTSVGGYKEIGTNYRFYFEELKEKALSGNVRLRLSAAHQFISFLYLYGEGPEHLHYGDERNTHIEKALRVMQAGVFRDLSLADIAKTVGLEESYLIRLFKSKMGTTPKRYYTKLKMEAAASLLSSTALPLARIAERLKPASEFHLSRLFKEYSGLAPSAYRKAYGRDLAELREAAGAGQ